MSSRTRLVSGAFTARRICGVATILASTLVPAFAQQEPARTPGTQAAGAASSETESERASVGLQEIIITAQFRTESVQDAPLAITAVSDEMLAARSHTNVIDVATRVPNVTLTSAGQGLGNSATAHIRGVGQSDFNFALEPGVGMYIDDVYHGVVFGTIFELVDLDRVEILRGPQGTLAGKNSVGGAIKLFSRKPDATPDGYIEATFGSFDRIDVRGSGDFVIVPDKLFARVSGLARQRDGYLTRLDYECVTGGASPRSERLGVGCEIGTEGGQRVWAARAALRWLPSDRFENNLIVDVMDDDSEPQATKLLLQGPWAGGNDYITPPKSYTNFETYVAQPGTPVAFGVPPISTSKSWGVSNTADVTFGDNLAFKSITAYREVSGQFSQASDASPTAVLTNIWDVLHRQFTQELRLSGTSLGERVDWTVGAFYYTSSSRMGGRISIAGGLVPGGGLALLPDGNRATIAEFLFDDPVDAESISGFAHAAVRITPALKLTGGVRYTEESKDYTFVRLATDGGPHPVLGPLNGVTGSYEGDRVDYRVALDYAWTDNLLTYVQWSTGFKGGGINPRPFFPDQVLPLNPETLSAYEIGFKSELANRRVRLNAAAFLNEYDDLQLGLVQCPPPATPTPCNMPANVGNAEIRGLEVEAELHPVPGLILDASASYIEFEYEDVDPLTGVTPDMTTPFMPERKFAFGGQYSIPLGQAGILTPRVDYVHQSAMYIAAVNLPVNRVDGYGLVNARLTWESMDATWQAALGVTNLADKFYYINKYDRAAAPYFVVNGQPGRPREWFITLTRKF